jgi:aspartate kinase
VTTLGRGGSDTTAVALAAALHAHECEIFTDVDGVYTADPRVVPRARKLSRVSYEEMFELAALGAKVMASRSIFLAMKFNVPIHVRHAMLPDQGTMIVQESPDMEQNVVTGVALKNNVGRITLSEVPNVPGLQARIFQAVAEANILVDDIIQNPPQDGRTRVAFTIDHTDLADVRPVVERLCERLGGGEVKIDVGLCRVSAVGVGMRTQTGVAARMFKALAEAPGGPINIQNITTSEIKIGCILAKEDGERALRAVHEAFELAAQPA